MEERKAFLLRIHEKLWKELEAWAGADLRSVNGQIEYLLKEAVARRKRGADRGTSRESPRGGPPENPKRTIEPPRA